MGPGRRRSRRRGLVVGAAIGSRAARNNSDNDAPQQVSPRGDNQLEELEKLGALKEKGILTDEEFQAKKKQILGI